LDKNLGYFLTYHKIPKPISIEYITWDRLSAGEKMCKVENYLKHTGIQGKDGNLQNTGKLNFPDNNAVYYDIDPKNKQKYAFYNGDYIEKGKVPIIGDHSINMTDLGLQSESIAYSSATHEAYHHFYPIRSEAWIRMMQLSNQSNVPSRYWFDVSSAIMGHGNVPKTLSLLNIFSNIVR
jgi:hypothetical protein